MRYLLKALGSGTLAGLLVVGLALSVARAQSIGGGGGGGGLTQSAANLLYCALAGCTMTGGTTYSGVTTDIQAAASETLLLKATGGGATLDLESTGGGVRLFNGSTQVGVLSLGTLSGRMMYGSATTTHGGFSLGNGTPVFGRGDNRTAAEVTGCVGDGVSNIGGTNLWCVYGEGKTAPMQVQTCTCVADAGAGGVLGGVTCDPTSALVYVANPDADGCIVTLSEATKVDNARTTFVVQTSSGGVVTFPNVAGVHAGPTFATTTGLGVGDSYEAIYATTLAAYQGVGVSDN